MRVTDLLSSVAAERAKTLALLESLAPADLERVHPETRWTVGQILGHIAAAELGSAFFIRRAGEGELIEMDLAARDQFNELETEKAAAFDLGALKSELADSAASLREVFDGLTEADLAKPIVWPEWPARTIGDSIPFIAGHEAEHRGHLQAALANR
jgi:uncharacterized damage-inducible protein DinB